MRHRHLNDDVGYQLAAIDDTTLLDGIERVCRAFAHDPYAQRHHFWLNHVRHRRETA